MNYFKLLIILFGLSIFSTSCGVVKMNTSTTKTLDIYGAGVIQHPVLVDLDVQESRVTGTSTGPASNFESVKQKALIDAVDYAGADVLVEPRYKTEMSRGRVTATVTGYPATYKNFRQMKWEDIELLQAGIVQKAEVHDPVIETKKRGFAWIFTLVGGVLLLALLL